MRGEQHGAQRDRHLVGEPAHRGRHVVGNRRAVLGDARRRVQRPPWDPAEAAGGLDSPRSLAIRARPPVRCGRLAELPGGVHAPARVPRHLRSLHQERVGGERRAVSHRDAVVDQGVDPERAAGSDRDPVRLEGAVLLRVRLDDAAGVERAVVADRDQRLLVDQAPSSKTRLPIRTPRARQASPLNGVPLRVLGELGAQLPVALVAPEVRLVDRAEAGAKRAEPGRARAPPGRNRRP